LPKSGGWLNSVKVVLGFIELALGLKFLSIADQTYHWGILDREIYLAFWIVIFTLMGFYLLGKIKFKHDSDVTHIGVPRLMLSIITFTFVVYLIPGMIGAPLKALAGYLPPETTHDFDLREVIRENAIVYSGVAKNNKAVCEKPKYADKLKLPLGLQGFFDYDQALACAKSRNKPVFVDFTGHGCVNCREMESRVWSDPRVLKRLNDNYVILALYVDDKAIQLRESEWITSTYDGKVKKTLGKKNQDFQITRFKQNTQPQYTLLDTNGELLIPTRSYNLDVDAFIEFLDKGSNEFARRSSQPVSNL
jgi:thiol:disulfide interchange protein DsbD